MGKKQKPKIIEEGKPKFKKGAVKFGVIYLLHEKHGSPEGTVSKIQSAIEPINPGVRFVRPLLPHHDPETAPEEGVEFLKNLRIPRGALLIGVNRGGLVAAKLQEESRPDLHVICISSPTSSGRVKLNEKMPNRAAFYSSGDEIIAGRVGRWPDLAKAYDLPWLTHDTDAHLDKLVKLIQGYINGDDLSLLV